jgi:hypothetical protein
MKKILQGFVVSLVLSTFIAPLSTCFAQGTAFTYQGRLNSGTNVATGSYDLRFALFDAVTAGVQQGSLLTNSATAVSNGLFTVTLDFGNQFSGAARWLEIAVRTNGLTTFTNLAPRQLLTPTPYAVYAGSANATNLVGTVSGSQIAAGSIGATQLSNSVSLWNRSGADISYTAGKVGVGTSTPAKALDVTGTSSGVASGASVDASIFVRVSNTASDGNTSSPDFAGIGFGRTAVQQAIVGGTFGNDVLDFYTGGSLTSPKMRIDFSGNVGIGTSSPLWSLHVLGAGEGSSGIIAAETTGGNGGPQLRLKVGGPFSQEWVFVANGTINGSVGDLQIVQQAGGSRMVIRTNGYIGMGTTAPQLPLDVNSVNYAVPAAQFGVANCGAPCAQTDRQEAIRLWNQNNNGQVGLGFLVGGGSFNSNAVPSVWMGTAYGAYPVGGNANDFQIATTTNSTGTNLINRVYVNGTSGNVGIGTNSPSTKLEVAGEITCVAVNITSDRNAKEEFKPVNAQDVLAKVVSLPITEWQYKSQTDARHIGPMAQDFRDAFTLGHDEKHISMVDESGVALAAIQGLNQKLETQAEEKNARIRELEESVSELKAMVKQLAALQTASSK